MILPGGWPDVAGWRAKGNPARLPGASWRPERRGWASASMPWQVQRHRCGSWTARRGATVYGFPGDRLPAVPAVSSAGSASAAGPSPSRRVRREQW